MRNVLRGMAKDKALGLDGFSMAFFQDCWDIAKDVMSVFCEFFSFRKLEKSQNMTFIALIPKSVGALDVKYFCPIDLANGMYEIISKVLANHTSTGMEKIVSKCLC